jgi:ATPase subunit of ABC transporter with duplicated ATPase domains
MSIIISDLTYRYPNQYPLFSNLNLSVESRAKVAIVGDNGTGKSTLLKLMARLLPPSEGSISTATSPYYVPQHTGLLCQTVAQALGVADKLAALHAIEQGSLQESHYDTLGDDWEVEAHCAAALAYWGLPEITLDMQMDELSGGEKTKVMLAGLLIHSPAIVLLDEPTNHLDRTSRELLYRYISQSKATIVVVSHDVTLLNLLPQTYELSELGMHLYGGNYSFYKEQKAIELNALDDTIHEHEKALKLARKQAQEVKQRQEKRTAKQGEKNKQQVPRIMRNTLRDSAEKTAAGLKNKHTEIVNESTEKLDELRKQKERLKELKINFDNAALHSGKLLIEAKGINTGYAERGMLWKKPIDFCLRSNDRIRLLGNNGTGKTTLAKLLAGYMEPAEGEIKRAEFGQIYLDQHYSMADVDHTVEQLAEMHNHHRLEDHEVKTRLNRFLFPHGTWAKRCKDLSGGEKMRLYLCCLILANQTPDLIILDEPTNNLDIASLQILTQTIGNYRGSLLVISHDDYFANAIGITGELLIGK